MYKERCTHQDSDESLRRGWHSNEMTNHRPTWDSISGRVSVMHSDGVDAKINRKQTARSASDDRRVVLSAAVNLPPRRTEISLYSRRQPEQTAAWLKDGDWRRRTSAAATAAGGCVRARRSPAAVARAWPSPTPLHRSFLVTDWEVSMLRSVYRQVLIFLVHNDSTESAVI